MTYKITLPKTCKHIINHQTGARFNFGAGTDAWSEAERWVYGQGLEQTEVYGNGGLPTGERVFARKA